MLIFICATLPEAMCIAIDVPFNESINRGNLFKPFGGVFCQNCRGAKKKPRNTELYFMLR
jgi:hypothetical protein